MVIIITMMIIIIITNHTFPYDLTSFFKIL